MRNLVWFRNDLRVLDNPALYHACSETGEVVGLYFLCEKQWLIHGDAACKINFWIRNLQCLQTSLKLLNIPLIVIKAPLYQDIENKILSFVDEHNITSVYFNNEYGVNELRRDRKVYSVLLNNQINVSNFHEQTIHTPGTLKTQAGDNFKVYSPFKRSWFKNLKKEHLEILPVPKRQNNSSFETSSLAHYLSSYTSDIDESLWPAGEEYIHDHVDNFLSQKGSSYKLNRDYPSLDATSKLSPYLNTGVVSSKWCLNKALEYNGMKLDSGDKGIVHWVSEILWREFYRHIIYNFPKVSKNKPFVDKTSKIKWNHDDFLYQKWEDGKTGIPIVDAGMRQLKKTGWMHNRIRMITAMFLSKNLLMDWQKGEKYFMQNLIDGDIASNNGGWQWSASTGTDAAPYFRIMNPVSQSKRFDPKGTYIRTWVHELEKCPLEDIHEPKNPEQYGYYEPIVDLKLSRKKAIDVFSNL
ncbi:MAG: FAD-binding domain-containing protein [Pseudomonadota bacterium]|nr:FAD-binding domain-containing protein [Pseudomonadota bacterium]